MNESHGLASWANAITAGRLMLSPIMFWVIPEGTSGSWVAFWLWFALCVSDGIDEATRAELRRRLYEIRRSTPFLDCRERATWVEPRVVCRVRFARWTKNDTLEQPQFESLLSGL